ncbi:MAG: SH3 domain-containing protein [Candidatus Binatia bacterium]
MGNREPASHLMAPFGFVRIRCPSFPAPRSLFSIAFVFLLCWGTVVWAQGNTAIVTGADHVFIRRGPGTGFPPFATLSEGATVEIQEMQGEWARVLTANGQSGYVNSTFLSLPGEHPAKPSAVAMPATTPTAASTPVEHQSAALRTLTEQNKSLSAEVRRLQDELATMKSQAEVMPSPAPTSAPVANEFERLHSDLARLGAAVEHLQRRLDVETSAPRENVAPSMAAPPEGVQRMTASTAGLLAAIGFCIGWLLGNAYGRRHERGRRPRVRL